MVSGPPIPASESPAPESPPPVILVLEHAELEHLGTLEAPLAAHAGLQTLRAYRDSDRYAREVDRAVRAASLDAVVVLGGPVSLLDKAVYEYLDESLRLVRAALRRDIPILGIGLGAHLVAWALGARVWAGRTRGKPGEFGWSPVDLVGRGKVDPAFHGFRELDSVFHWHTDSCDLPAEAWRLAETTHYLQAFRWGRWVYGLQFHLEVTGQMVADWVDARGDELATVRRADPDLIVAKAARYCPLLKPKVETLATFFLECIETSRAERERGKEHAGSPASALGLGPERFGLE